MIQSWTIWGDTKHGERSNGSTMFSPTKLRSYLCHPVNLCTIYAMFVSNNQKSEMVRFSIDKKYYGMLNYKDNKFNFVEVIYCLPKIYEITM